MTCSCILCTGQCINYLYVWAFTSDIRNSQSKTNHNITLMAKGLKSTQRLPKLPKGQFEQEVGDLWKLNIKTDFKFTTCITLFDIQSISIVPDSNDAWNIGSIATFAVVNSDCWELISADYSVNQWVDGDGAAQNREFVLSLTTSAGPCINYLRVMAYTSDGATSQTNANVAHEVELTADGLSKIATLSNLPNESRGYLWNLSLAEDFGFAGCIRKKDVQGIAIVADHNDGWKIDSIVTYVTGNKYNWELSSVDFNVNQWIQQNDPSRQRFDLNLVI